MGYGVVSHRTVMPDDTHPAPRPYDPAKDEKLPWEDDVAAAICFLASRRFLFQGTATVLTHKGGLRLP